MKYYIDTEFLEGTQLLKKTFLEALLAIKINTKPTIDLISIGIVAEDGREYYAISKDFNLKEAWNRFDIKGIIPGFNYPNQKEYWIRENVLKPIFEDMTKEQYENWSGNKNPLQDVKKYIFNYTNFKWWLNRRGKTNKQIAEEVKDFIYTSEGKCCSNADKHLKKNLNTNISFYGWYSDYDWVVFCWLFGKMIDLPKGFPQYCNDLAQTFNEKKKLIKGRLKDQHDYPINNGVHNALEDARWNKKLHKFLEKI